jgi:nitrite reductase/ring-hydroxylating ferredoxin subunit
MPARPDDTEQPRAADERVRAPVARAADVPDGGGLAVSIEGRQVALFRMDDAIVAVQGECLHRGGPLALGDLRGTVLTCPWHWWRYDLRTGRRVDDPSVCLERYPVEIEDGFVVVTVPAARPPQSWRDRLLRHARAATDSSSAGGSPGIDR